MRLEMKINFLCVHASKQASSYTQTRLRTPSMNMKTRGGNKKIEDESHFNTHSLALPFFLVLLL
jgi:hypothetical protein